MKVEKQVMSDPPSANFTLGDNPCVPAAEGGAFLECYFHKHNLEGEGEEDVIWRLWRIDGADNCATPREPISQIAMVISK